MANAMGGLVLRSMVVGALAMVGPACSAKLPTGPSGTSGESHFLRFCSGSCGDGLACISGVCTRGCIVNKDSCSDLSSGAVCTSGSIEPGAVAVCDLGCTQDGDCVDLGSTHRCLGGYCRSSAPFPTAEAGAAGSGGTSNPAGGAGGSVEACVIQDGGSNPQGDGETISGPPVFACPDPLPSSDPIEISRSLVAADTLSLSVKYLSPCNLNHEFSVCYGPAFAESYPVQTSLHLIHNAHGDLPQEGGHRWLTLEVDLKPLAAAYEASYPGQGAYIRTNFGLYASGAASCEEQRAVASAEVAAATAEAQDDCFQDSDCQIVWIGTQCSTGCSTIASSVSRSMETQQTKISQSNLSSVIQKIDSQLCGAYVANGCPPVASLPCVPPPSLVCNSSGHCVEAGH